MLKILELYNYPKQIKPHFYNAKLSQAANDYGKALDSLLKYLSQDEISAHD